MPLSCREQAKLRADVEALVAKLAALKQSGGSLDIEML